MNADQDLKERLSRAAESLRLDVEHHLEDVHGAGTTDRQGRRLVALIVGVAVAVMVALMIQRLLPRGTSTRPADAGPSGRIAFMRITDSGGSQEASRLFVADAGTATESQLPEAASYALFPVWSPDGERVAFASGQAGQERNHLTVMNADGSGLVDLGGGNVTTMSWSPDGSQIAYTDSPGVYAVGPDGTGLRQVVPGNWDSVSWSPDGRLLLLTGQPVPTKGDANVCPPDCPDIYTIRPDGSDLTQLTNDDFYEHYAVWSPDGTKVAFSRSTDPDDASPTSEIYVMNADGSGLMKLTDSPGLDFLPTWSPDGRWIAFASVRGATDEQKQAIADGKGFGGLSIWLMGADGSDPKMLVDGGPDVVAPTSWTR